MSIKRGNITTTAKNGETNDTQLKTRKVNLCDGNGDGHLSSIWYVYLHFRFHIVHISIYIERVRERFQFSVDTAHRTMLLPYIPITIRYIYKHILCLCENVDICCCCFFFGDFVICIILAYIRKWLKRVVVMINTLYLPYTTLWILFVPIMISQLAHNFFF